VGLTPLLAGEGADDYATASVRLDGAVATVSCAVAEVGQGFATVAQQIVREVLGVREVLLAPFDSAAPSAGPAAFSRLTWMAGGAVRQAAAAVLQRVCAEVGAAHGLSPDLLTVRDGRVLSYDGLVDVPLAGVAAARAVEETVTFRHPPTEALDEHGQGAAYAAFGYAAHRAVADVDVDLGLVRVVDVTVAHDVGCVINPLQLIGCVEGGTAAGVGLALAAGGRLRALDQPPVRIAALLEQPEPGAPFGAKGVWDAPVGPAAAAVLAAVRDATGLDVRRLPIRPEDLAGASARAVASEQG
jgi:CO/xanthine dehydrogenase Mo-binding subunit